MVNVHFPDKNQFIAECMKRRVFCFGGGQFFAAFLEDYPSLAVEGIIDNFLGKDLKKRDYGEKTVTIYSLKDFCDIYQSSIVIVLTSAHYIDMLCQMDEKKKLDGADIFIYSLVKEEDSEKQDAVYALKKLRIEGRRVGKDKSGEKNWLKKCQIWEILPDSRTAGGKAPRDMKDILIKEGFVPINVHMYDEDNRNQLGWRKEQADSDWDHCYEVLSENAIIVLQHPFRQRQEERNRILLRLKEEKRVRIISIVHDVEKIRGVHKTAFIDEEFSFMLRIADVLIVHNEWMKKYIEAQGYASDRIVVLHLFDYLLESKIEDKVVKFEKSVTFAGSLERVKSLFAYHLDKLEPIKFHLYGPFYEPESSDNKNKNVIYHGSADADQLPDQLDAGFGLIWDGMNLDTCSGGTGEYLKYINPHKLSLYMAAGLPVIIWEKAAGAVFVTDNHVGYAIKSLFDIAEIMDTMKEDEYYGLCRNVETISAKVRAGSFSRKAINEALSILQENSGCR